MKSFQRTSEVRLLLCFFLRWCDGDFDGTCLVSLQTKHTNTQHTNMASPSSSSISVPAAVSAAAIAAIACSAATYWYMQRSRRRQPSTAAVAAAQQQEVAAQPAQVKPDVREGLLGLIGTPATPEHACTPEGSWVADMLLWFYMQGTRPWFGCRTCPVRWGAPFWARQST